MNLRFFYHREVLVGARKMLRELIRKGIETGEFRDGAYAKEPQILISPAIFAAIWKMTFDSVEKLNTLRWLEAHIDIVLAELQPNRTSKVAAQLATAEVEICALLSGFLQVELARSSNRGMYTSAGADSVSEMRRGRATTQLVNARVTRIIPNPIFFPNGPPAP